MKRLRKKAGGGSGSDKNMASINIQQFLYEHDGSMKRSTLIRELHSVGASIPTISQKLKDLEIDGSIKTSGDIIILVPICKAEQMILHGNQNEDGSMEPIGHNQVSIPYDKTLFRVVDESDKLLDEITVDDGMIELLRAIWRHKIPTFHSCQGTEGDKAWIRFMWRKDVPRFLDLVPQSSNNAHWGLGFIEDEKNYQISFPPEDIARITEELNSKPIS